MIVISISNRKSVPDRSFRIHLVKQIEVIPGSLTDCYSPPTSKSHIITSFLFHPCKDLIFAFAFVEPQMVFYFYDDLGWSTVQFGVVVALYGGFIVIGQALLGRMSDRIGRKPVILLGTALYGTFFLGLVLFDSYLMLLLIAVIAGLGEALMLPALSAFYIDITPEQHRSRVIGIKESAASLGGVAGPLLVIAVSPYLDPAGVFMVGFLLVALTFIIGQLLLREPGDLTRREKSAILTYSQQRSLLAQATLQGMVTSAKGVRFQRKKTAGSTVEPGPT